MLENATRICEAKFGTLLLCEGDAFRRVALHNAAAAYGGVQRARAAASPAERAESVDRVVETKQAGPGRRHGGE